MPYLHLMAALFLLALLGGCGRSDMADLQAFVAEIRERKPLGISPAPEPLKVTSFPYIAAGRRDPFTPQKQSGNQVQAIAGKGIEPDKNRRKEALENYPLDTLSMVGTLKQNNIVWGLVKTQDGVVHRVTHGSYMGMNHGRVVDIKQHKIKLIELIQIGDGFQEQEAGLGLKDVSLLGEKDVKK
jgi:type IV pilus assembly protein PilP